jgi:hypothetical protein
MTCSRYAAVVLTVCTVLLLPAVAQAFRLDETWRRSFPVRPGAEFVLDNTSGSIRIEVGAPGSIEVTAEIRIKSPSKWKAERLLEELRFSVDADSSRVAVEARLPRIRQDAFIGLVFGRSTTIAVRYAVRVPRETRLRLANTNGDIKVDGVSGAFTIATESGDVEASFAGGEGEITTMDGSIDLSLGRFSRHAVLSLRAVNGDIEAALPATIDAALDASALNGGIEVDVAAFGRRVFKRGRFEGTAGTGEGSINLKTTNGNIFIRSNPL